MEELEKCHRKQQMDMQTEIKKEMALLQKKMLMESVRKGRERERISFKHCLTLNFSNIKRYPMFVAHSRTC